MILVKIFDLLIINLLSLYFNNIITCFKMEIQFDNLTIVNLNQGYNGIINFVKKQK